MLCSRLLLWVVATDFASRDCTPSQLVRLAKTSRVLARLNEYVSLSSTTQTCISLSFKALLLTHWIACILMISTTFAIIPTSSWLGTYGYCQIVDDTSDVKVPEVECVETGHLYLMVFKWSLAFVFHNGFSFSPQPGPYEPYYDGTTNLYGSKLTDGEEIVIIFLKLFGIGFWSLTISKLIRSITVLGNPALIAYQQDIDSVNRFCTFNRLPTNLTRELRRYVLTTKEVHEQLNRSHVYSKLSPLLVTKVTRQLNRPLYDSAFIQRGLRTLSAIDGERFVSALVTTSTMSVYAPGDHPPPKRLYIITEGVAIRQHHILGVGASWGDEDVLLSVPPTASRETKSVTYLRVVWLSRDDFRKLWDDYPSALGALRAHAIFKRARSILRQNRDDIKRARGEKV